MRIKLLLLTMWLVGLLLVLLGFYLEPKMIVEFGERESWAKSYSLYFVSLVMNLTVGYKIAFFSNHFKTLNILKRILHVIYAIVLGCSLWLINIRLGMWIFYNY